MSVITAREIIARELEQSADKGIYESVEFYYMGGEPLLNFSLIQETCECSWQQKWEIPYHFYVVTNGTLLDYSKMQWFEAHSRQITIELSVDGFNKMQEINRGCSTHSLPIDWVHRLWPEQCFKMTVSKKTLKDFAKGMITLQTQGYQTNSDLAIGVAWNELDAREYARQLEILSDFYLSHQHLRPCHLLLRNIEPLFTENPSIEKCCTSGGRAITYHANGKPYPCVVFTPLVFGKDLTSELSQMDFSDNKLFTDPECKTCFIRNMCKTCYGYNYKIRGNLAQRDKAYCPMYRAEIKAICKFQTNYLRKQQRALSSKEQERLDKAEKGWQNLENYKH